MAEINGIRVPFVPIIPGESTVQKPAVSPSGSRFESIFKEELESIKFSAHASKRLESRNIQLSESEMAKLNDAVNKAELKGAKDSLVMMSDTAFIINIPNKTVVTALPVEQGSENVFTNIDSVVFAT